MLEFELHQLGWFGFEQLCRTICSEIWNQPVEAYSRGPDGGRDGFLFGHWDDRGTLDPAILQCKHTSSSQAHLSLSSLRRELRTIQRHITAGRCHTYVLMSNAKVTGRSAAAITSAFRKQGVQRVIIQGFEALCEQLTAHKALRSMVPRLYGLGDLTEILDERSYAQASAILAMMHDDLARLVPVEAQRAAFRSLRDNHFVCLVGRPGSGKSSIAASLAIGAMDLYDSRPIKLATVDDLRRNWNPRDPNQFFWLDDAFGATQYEQASSASWNRNTAHIDGVLHRGSRLIVTSRDYIYAAARDDLKLGSFPLLDEERVVIRVEEFTREEREQILYNHLRLGRQPRSVLRAAKPAYLETVAMDPAFLPELARRLGEPLFTRQVRFDDRESLLEFFRRPVNYLLEVLTNLDAPSRAALGLVHLRGGRLPSPYEALPGDSDFLQKLGTDISEVRHALGALAGSFLRLVSDSRERWWQFLHPTFSDVYQLWLSRDPELLAEYLATATFDELTRTITCGDVGLEGALLIPAGLYDLVAARLDPDVIRIVASGSNSWAVWSSWDWFLGRRCSAEFRRRFVTQHPSVVDKAFNIGLYLSAYTSRRELCRVLLDEKLATDQHRRHIVETLTEYAADFEDGSFLNDSKWLSFFTEEELSELDRRVTEALPDLEEYISGELGSNESSLTAIESSVAGYAARYPRNPAAVGARKRIEAIKAYEPEGDSWAAGEGPDDAVVAQTPGTAPGNGGPSIFDDVADPI